MTKEKLGQEPAFARATVRDPLNKFKQINGSDDMSKRFYAACTAMQGLLSQGFNKDAYYKDDKIKGLITRSYELADELLKQEND